MLLNPVRRSTSSLYCKHNCRAHTPIRPNLTYMFPIICLVFQVEAINKAIAKYNLTRDEILKWLSLYGEIVYPGQRHSVRGLLVMYEGQANDPPNIAIYVWISPFGFKYTFRIFENNQIHCLRGFYDMYSIWVEK